MSRPARARRMNDDRTSSTLATGVVRWLLVASGSLLVALAAVGAFLPVLPTTPFLIVAAACFARSSPAFQRRLMENRVFGPYLRQWRHDRTIPRAAKRKAYGLMVASFALSIYFVDRAPLRVFLLVLGLALVVFLARLPTTAVSAGDAGDAANPRG